MTFLLDTNSWIQYLKNARVRFALDFRASNQAMLPPALSLEQSYSTARRSMETEIAA
jgi:hypothetical protein